MPPTFNFEEFNLVVSLNGCAMVFARPPGFHVSNLDGWKMWRKTRLYHVFSSMHFNQQLIQNTFWYYAV